MPRIKARWAACNPAPTRDIPVLIGGGGERKTLRVVAEHADAWHSFGDVETLRRKSAILDEHGAGRRPGHRHAGRAVGRGRARRPSEVADALVEAGVTLFTVGTSGPDYDLSLAARVGRLARRAALTRRPAGQQRGRGRARAQAQAQAGAAVRRRR